MDIIELFKNGDLITSEVENYHDLYEEFNEMLHKIDYVEPDFLREIIKREKIFPTGIEGGKYNVALPHVDATYVKTNALFICRLPNKIDFVKMDDHSQKIEVQLVFLLLIHDLKLHVKAISELTRIWTNDSIMNGLLLSENKEQALKTLEKL